MSKAELRAAIHRAFEDFDLAMDPILDETQEMDMQGAISIALAVRLVAYTTQVGTVEAEAIAASLVKELRDLRRSMKFGMAEHQ